jgi:hypothetical protein
MPNTDLLDGANIGAIFYAVLNDSQALTWDCDEAEKVIRSEMFLLSVLQKQRAPRKPPQPKAAPRRQLNGQEVINQIRQTLKRYPMSLGRLKARIACNPHLVEDTVEDLLACGSVRWENRKLRLR